MLMRWDGADDCNGHRIMRPDADLSYGGGYTVPSMVGTGGSGSFHERRDSLMCLKVRFTRGATAAAVFGTW
jgi:hypothetical protein